MRDAKKAHALHWFSLFLVGGRRQKKFQSAAGRLDGIWYLLLGLKRQNMVCNRMLVRGAIGCWFEVQ
jgi:hypothetical protein